MEYETDLVIVDSDLNAADGIIENLDAIIQGTHNMELSKQLNEISDTYQMIRKLIKAGNKTD